MSSALSGLAGVAQRSGSEAVAFGLGFALGAALEPAGTAIRQEAWKVDPLRAPDAALLAEGVAQGQVDEGAAREWAKEHGYGDAQWAAMVSIANTGPALGYAFQAWRRGLLTDTAFRRALKRTGLEDEWDGALEGLKGELLDLGALATAIHRGIIGGAGLLIREPPAGEGQIPRVTPSSLDPLKEAAGHGVDEERLRVLVGNTGLPLALGQMLQLLNRGLVSADDVRRSVAQSNVRNEYMDAALELRRRLLTPHEYAELRVRGWIDTGAMHAGTALSGMTEPDSELLFKLLGRPIPVRQVTTGLARGGTYDGPAEGIPEAYRRTLQQGNLRPEWYNLAFHNRYTIPSYFVLRALLTSGALTEADAAQLFRESGWRPDLADKAAAALSKGQAATTRGLTASEHLTEYEGLMISGDELRARLAELGYSPAEADEYVRLGDARRVRSARDARLGRIRTQYVGHKITEAAARDALAGTGIPADAQALLLEQWTPEREVNVSRLTDAQVKKAYRAGLWNREQALNELEDRGFTPADAATLLDE